MNIKWKDSYPVTTSHVFWFV